MCMKVFALQRCLSPENGGCGDYFADYLEQRECNHMALPGLPQHNCRAVWAGFEDERSAKALHRDEYAKRAHKLCADCRVRHRLGYLDSEAQAERRGEYSERMKTIIEDLTRRADLGQMEFMNRVYRDMWDAALGYVQGMAKTTDGVWNGIEGALRRHFGDGGMEMNVVGNLVRDLKIAKEELLEQVMTSTREMATALVGPNMDFQQDLEAGGFRSGYITEEWKLQRRAAVDASRATAEAGNLESNDEMGREYDSSASVGHVNKPKSTRPKSIGDMEVFLKRNFLRSGDRPERPARSIPPRWGQRILTQGHPIVAGT
ncbi:uncharacterized protein CLUP02_16287 [Colletotrichum lupini]|uniref:Uncharacterized protein n=1 Tax=Colletotrichum lupini TaxID=145971 RepID=A0A9Q8WPU1_9PEZI|nr:uncharacterized protein CLUP02_16287 [Colletotrichum lupini]UQC90757.1 hypothetical protein CLUP02_16287 [Colletotrichum lupini]